MQNHKQQPITNLAIVISPADEVILIAEDDDASRHLLKRGLESEGYQVAAAKDGVEALQLFMLKQPAIILLDAQMPRLDGFSVCKQIMAMPEGQHTQIIMITALDDERSVNRAFEAGAVDYLTKPIHWPVLFQRLRRKLQMAHAAEVMEEQHNLLRTVIDNLPDYIFVKDTAGRFVISNTAHTQAAGFASAEELVGRVATEAFPEELAAQFASDDMEVMKSGEARLNLERTTVGPDNQLKSVLTTKVPLRDRHGDVVGLIGISRDITQRKHDEEALKRAHADLEQRVEERTAQLTAANAALEEEIAARRLVEARQTALTMGLREVVASANEFIVCPDVDTLCKRAVEFAREKLGVERAAIFMYDGDWMRGTYGTNLQGQTTDEHTNRFGSPVLLGRMENPEPDSAGWIAKRDIYEWNGKEGVLIGQGESAITPIRSARKLLGVFCNDSAITKTSLEPIIQEVMIVFCSLLGNIIEQKQVEAALFESQQQLRRITDNMMDIICQTDDTGIIQYASPSIHDALGYNPQKLIGQSIYTWIDPDDLELVKDAIHNIGRVEYRFQKADGEYIWLETLSSWLFEDSSMPIGIVWASRDITERKRAEQELQDLNRLKTEFLSTAAHELRTPLVSIRGFTEILLTRQLEATRQQRYLTLINEQSIQLGKILDDLLDISRLEAKQRMTLALEPVNMTQVINNVVSLFEVIPNHVIQIQGFENCPLVVADEGRVSQVLKNLVSNAIKYSPDGGVIKIRGQALPGFLQISVLDTGLGLTTDQISHLFEKFYRANASNTAIGGTGLGLAICKLIIDLHNGDLWAESTYGEGSTFNFTLPFVAINQVK